VQPSGGRVPIHPGAAPGPQYRTHVPFSDRVVNGSADGGWKGCEDHLGPFAGDPQHPVAMFLAEVGDVGAAGFEDP
jgi:hypothetical protein